MQGCDDRDRLSVDHSLPVSSDTGNLFQFLWMPAFGVPNTLRAAGDVVWPMSVAIFSMWVFRVVLAYVFTYVCHFGLVSIWMAMFIDWVVREIFYVLRYKGHKWEHFAQKS